MSGETGSLLLWTRVPIILFAVLLDNRAVELHPTKSSWPPDWVTSKKKLLSVENYKQVRTNTSFECLLQGRNEVYFFVADPVFLRKFLIPDPKNDENF